MPKVVAQVLDQLVRAGKENVAVNLANGLARQGFESLVISTRKGGPLEAELDPEVGLLVLERHKRFDMKVIRRFNSFLAERNVQLVHTHGNSSHYFVQFAFLWSKHRPIHVLHEHGAPETEGLNGLVRNMTDRLLLRRGDLFISCCEPMQAHWKSLLGLSDSRCIYLPNGVPISAEMVDYASFDAPAELRISQVANVRHPKGHQTAVRAAALLNQAKLSFRWSFVGKIPPAGNKNHPYYAQVISDLNELKVDRQIELTGEQEFPGDILRKSHIGVLSSDSEAFPLALLEYMGAGLPVVATDVGQVREIVESSECGFVVPRGDCRGLADAILKLAGDPGLAKQLGRNGRAYVTERFSLSRMVENIAAEYRKLLGDS